MGYSSHRKSEFAASSLVFDPPPQHLRDEADPQLPSPDLVPSKPVRQIRSILLLGETGSGKSTFINYLANYFLGGSLQSLKVVIPTRWQKNPTEEGYSVHSEANLEDMSVSQTQKSTVYRFPKDGNVYSFIDTPGFGDTANCATHSVDDQTTQMILKAASQAGELHAIILVINGSAPKLTINMKTALQRIAGNYPDVLRNNMLVVYTNTNAAAGLNFSEKLLVHPPQQSFHMNNCAFATLPAQWTDEDVEVQTMLWPRSMRKIHEMVEIVGHMKPQSTGVFRDMLASRNEIKGQLMRATYQIGREQHLMEILTKLKAEEGEIQRKIDQDLAQLGVSDSDIAFYHSQERQTATARLLAEKEGKLLEDLRTKQSKSAKSSSSEEIISAAYKQLRDTSYHSTLCRKCSTTCHEKCNLDYTQKVGNNIFKDCACMNESQNCTVCRCTYVTHVHDKCVFDEAVLTESMVNMSIFEKQRSRMRELDAKISNSSNKAKAAQQEAESYNTQLKALRQKSSNYLAEETRLRQLREEALSKKIEAEAAISKAQLQRADVETKRTGIEAQLQETMSELREAEIIVRERCKDLKAVCSNFDFIMELNITKESLQMSLSTLRNPEVRQNAEEFIHTLDRLAEDLQKQLL